MKTENLSLVFFGLLILILLFFVTRPPDIDTPSPAKVEIFVEMESRTLVNDAPTGSGFTIVTKPATPNLSIHLKVFRARGEADGKPLLATQTFNSVLILQNGVVTDELVTDRDGLVQGELVAGFGGQGPVELFFETDDPTTFYGPIPIGLTNPPRGGCGCPEEIVVDPHSGENSVTETDVSITMRSDFRINRTYRSQGTHRRNVAKGDVGVDWAFTFISDYLVKDGGNVIVFRDSNRTDVFTATVDPDVFAAPLEFYEALRRNPIGNFELRSADGTLKVYAGFNDPRIPGRLTHQEDRNGNIMSFFYQTLIGTNRRVLTTAVDTMGRNIQFRYYPTNDPNPGRRGRLPEIEDFRGDGSSSGRVVIYDYDLTGHLISVRSPTITSPAFPNTHTKYQLSVGVSTFRE